MPTHKIDLTAELYQFFLNRVVSGIAQRDIPSKARRKLSPHMHTS